ncbi:hypothetical protein L1283_003425 [Sphingobacterium sp. HSC-15S19]
MINLLTKMLTGFGLRSNPKGRKISWNKLTHI